MDGGPGSGPAGGGALTTATSTRSPSPRRTTVTAAPGAYRAALVSASRTTRCAACAAIGGSCARASAPSRRTAMPASRAPSTSSVTLSSAGRVVAAPSGSRSTPMIPCSRSVAAATLARSSPAAARCRGVEVAGDLQGGGAQGDQAQVVPERVVHLLGDPGPLPQPDPLGGTPPLARSRASACRRPASASSCLLTPVPPDEPREHPGEEQHRGEQEPGGRAGAEQPQVERGAAGREQRRRRRRPGRRWRCGDRSDN